jgi:hypothetical protein
MQQTSAADWYAREVAQLRAQVALFSRLLEALTSRGKADADTPRARDGDSHAAEHCLDAAQQTV